MPFDAPDFRQQRGLLTTGEVEIDAFDNVARLNPSEETVLLFKGPPGPIGPPGDQGDTGPSGEPGPPGAAGAAGVPGATGPTGPAGMPGTDGKDGEDGHDGLPGPVGQTGPTGVQGFQGFPGNDGADGQDGNDGPPGPTGPTGPIGPTGPTGPAGAQGAPGPQGQDADEPPIMFVMPTSQTTNNIVSGSPENGLVLSATNQTLEVITANGNDVHYEVSFQDTTSSSITPGSSAAAITTATTTTVVSAPSASTQRSIVEANFYNNDTGSQTLTVQKDVGGTNIVLLSVQLGPSERLEFTSSQGWRVFDSAGREKKGITFISTSTSYTLSPGEQVGLQIDAAGAGAAVALSGAEQGETIRFSTMQDDTTTTGDQGATSYPIFEPVTMVNFTASAPVIIHGVAFSGAGGGTAVASAGRFVRVFCRGSSHPIIWKHLSTTEASPTRRLRCPGGRDYIQYPHDAILIWDDPSIGNRMVFPLESGVSSGPAGPGTFEWDRQDFLGHTGAVGAATTQALAISQGNLDPCWMTIANAARGTYFCTAHVNQHHKGVTTIETGNVISDYISVFRDNTTTVGGTGSSYLLYDQIAYVEMWVSPSASISNKRQYAGVLSAFNFSGTTVSGVYFQYDSAAGAVWRCITRDGSTNQITATSVAVVAGNWYKLSFRQVTTGNWLFFINDDFVAMHNVNVPSGAGFPGFHVESISSAAAKDFLIDRINIWLLEEGLRT